MRNETYTTKVETKSGLSGILQNLYKKVLTSNELWVIINPALIGSCVIDMAA